MEVMKLRFEGNGEYFNMKLLILYIVVLGHSFICPLQSMKYVGRVKSFKALCSSSPHSPQAGERLPISPCRTSSVMEVSTLLKERWKTPCRLKRKNYFFRSAINILQN